MLQIGATFRLKGQEGNFETFIEVLQNFEGHCRVLFYDVNKETKNIYHEYESTLSFAAIKKLYEEVK